VVVVDRPSAPSDLAAKDVFADRATLSWKPPADDGGAELTGYVSVHRPLSASKT